VHKSISVLTPTLLASLVVAACGSSSSSKPATSAASSRPATTSSSGGSSAAVKTARNTSLGATVLVNSQGMTLYHLSGEQRGRFICTSSACVGIWHPLTVAKGGAPSGAASLGTVKRPDGTEQVTYKGMPLYTFAQDTHEGEAKGQGIKDVGTWSAVTTSSTARSAPAATKTTSTTTPSTTTSTPSGGGGYGY
jgi:predicted lipoprotein with Yx(FWY)xxD motif